jgi:hypothetical protein
MTLIPLEVKHFVKISNQRILKDDDLIFESKLDSFSEFADELYRYGNIAYPKFHKMDQLSKLGFLGAEFLLQNVLLKEEFAQDRIGIILANQNASLDTDKKYYNLLSEGKASPAVFVYTLPNIVIGEICIKHGIKGENTFFISSEYDVKAQVSYINTLFAANEIDACIGGWVELLGNQYECFMYVVARNSVLSAVSFTDENILKYYKSNI